MKTAILVVLGLAVVAACVQARMSPWHTWKRQYGKTYENRFEEESRRKIFMSNLHKIKEHNALYEQGLKTFTVGLNKFADMRGDEFSKQRKGLRFDANKLRKSHQQLVGMNDPLPASVDWRKKNAVTHVKDQGQCASSWAFSAVASLEGLNALTTGNLTALSEQNLVDCSNDQGNLGCIAGFATYAFEYVVENNGIDTEASYPYKGDNGTCQFQRKNVGANMSSWVDIAHRNETALQVATAYAGPISVTIDSSSWAFQFYTGGVYIDDECTPFLLDHSVTVVGYGTLNGTAYWTVKNSWGKNWGDKGYILMARNRSNQCGISTQACFPFLHQRL